MLSTMQDPSAGGEAQAWAGCADAQRVVCCQGDHRPGGCRKSCHHCCLQQACSREHGSFSSAIHLLTATGSEEASWLAKPLPCPTSLTMECAGVILWKYFLWKIHAIDCNRHPQRCHGRSIKTIDADFDFIRTISEMVSSKAPLPARLPRAVNHSTAHLLCSWCSCGPGAGMGNTGGGGNGTACPGMDGCSFKGSSFEMSKRLRKEPGPGWAELRHSHHPQQCWVTAW